MKDNLKSSKFKGIFVSNVILLFSFLCFSSQANNYYFSASGSDGNAGSSPSSAWKTLNKFNSTSFSPGDNIYFNRGDVFYGSLTIKGGGSAGNPITIDAYGSGPNPVITGFTTVSSWTNIGGNIWESSSPVSSLSSCNMVAVNGVNTPMGRYPNTGYLTYQSYSGSTSITSSSIDGSNWAGAEAVLRRDRYIIDRNPISYQSGGTLTFSGGGNNNGQNNWGFFIQNDVRTLDQQNEWYYNPTTKKVDIYSTNSPGNVQVSSIDNLVNMVLSNYVTFKNLSFSGANTCAFAIGRCQNITVQNCSIDFCYNGILGEQFGGSQLSSNFTLQNSVINHTNNNALDLTIEFSNATISNNIIKNTGMLVGMGVGVGSDWITYTAIYVAGDNTLIQNNEIDSTGFMGIGFDADFVTVKNNIINYYCATKDDGGGIYTFGPRTNRNISYNTVLNGVGNGDGTSPYAKRATGIYCDDNSNNIQISNNSVASSQFAGIFLHNANNINIANNTTYDNEIGILIKSDINGASLARNISMHNNIVFAKTTGAAFTPQDQEALQFATVNNDISSFGNIDSNYYARPIDDNLTTMATLIGVVDNRFNLGQWQSYSSFDSHSNKSPKTVSTTDDLRFEYNSTNSSKTISLPYNYIDVRNVSYNGSITLAPYTSAVLIKNGPASGNQAPVANAGGDGSITLPINTVTLSGSGTDADGTISSYKWTEVSGPSSAIITSPNSATTSVSSMIQGTYKFQLQVTDNNGATGEDTVQISVINSTSFNGNIAPVADAGGDGTIILPINSVPLTGTGTDADGTVVGYKWSQVSGPATASIVSPNTAATWVTGMIAGVYQFQLTVTDNSGATGTSTVNIRVISSSNISPVANAGGDGTIILPINSVPLTGTGTDADGTVVGYKWSQVSGPATASIVSPNTAATWVTGMIAGVYQFQLTVTDNSGATGTSTVNIRVISSSNISPVANAGGNGTITLPTNSVPLTGTGTDADGTIVAYQWSQISGPSAANITSPNTSATTVTNMVEGSYQFQLTVTDNSGATGNATVTIKVVSSALSGTVTNTSISTPVFGVTAYPNPFTNYVKLNITGGTTGSYSVIIADASGQIVWNKTGVMNSGTFQLTINTSNLKSGIYFLKFSQNNSNSVIKLEKLK